MTEGRTKAPEGRPSGAFFTGDAKNLQEILQNERDMRNKLWTSPRK
nr:MAG TPA: hypothetical protein [Caudoviricetes sp.]